MLCDQSESGRVTVSHGYDGYVFDENNNRIDFKGYRADCINQFALDYLDQYTGEKPF